MAWLLTLTSFAMLLISAVADHASEMLFLSMGVIAVGAITKDALSYYPFSETKRRLGLIVQKHTFDQAIAEDEWKRTFDSVPDLISIHDRDFRILRVNKAFAEKFGVLKEEIEGRYCYEVFHNRSAPLVNCPFHRTIETGKPAVEDVEDSSMEGVFSMYTSPIFEDDKIIGAVHICRDITRHKKIEEALKDSEKKYRNLVENALVGIFSSNLEGNILYVNEALPKMLEFDSRDQMMLRSSLWEYKNPEDGEALIEILKIKGNVDNFEIEVLTKTGKTKNLLLSATRDRDVISGMVVDITEQKVGIEELKKAHGKLKLAYEELKVLDKMKEEFLSNVSHELKTPLTSIICVLDILAGGGVSLEHRELIPIARRNADRLDALIGDLLSCAKMEYGPETLDTKEHDLGEVIRTSVKATLSKAQDCGISIETHFEGDLRAWVDKKAMFKVLSNLLNNAVKFNNRGGRVAVRAWAGLNGCVKVSVSDTGIGIPKEHLGKIFNRFYQVDGSTKRKYQGTGLGLSMVKGIVEKHGGRIWVESDVGKGSRFIFEIPKKDNTAEVINAEKV